MTDLTPPTEEEYQAAVRRDHARRHVEAAQHIEGAWGQDLITEEDERVLADDSPEQVRRDHDIFRRRREWEKRQRRAKA